MGFSRVVARVAAADLWKFSVALHQVKWSRFLSWCDRQRVNLCKASVPQVMECFLLRHQDLGLYVPAVKGYQAALNYVFPLSGMDLASNPAV